MAEGIVEDTVEEFEAHPYWFIGGFVALALVIIYLKMRGGSKPQNFTFSYGPSDAQLQAQAATQIASTQAQTSLSLAGIQAGVDQSYIGYLTNQGNNAASVAKANTAAALTLGQEQTNVGYQENLYDTNASYLTALEHNATTLATANIGYQENLYDTNAAYLTALTKAA